LLNNDIDNCNSGANGHSLEICTSAFIRLTSQPPKEFIDGFSEDHSETSRSSPLVGHRLFDVLEKFRSRLKKSQQAFKSFTGAFPSRIPLPFHYAGICTPYGAPSTFSGDFRRPSPRVSLTKERIPVISTSQYEVNDSERRYDKL
jgi:hypothetical protein